MRFKEFLLEADHKRELTVEQATALLEEHCKDAMKLFHRPLWRGTRNSSSDAYLIHGEDENARGRVSKNTSNYYTVIMDKFLPYFGYPKRSKSIILANNENYDYTRSFGRAFAIFPYDGVEIGVCQQYDLWETSPFKIGQYPDKHSLTSWNHIFRKYLFSAESWNEFKQSVIDAMEKETSEATRLREWFGPPEKIDDVFRKAYSPETLNMELSNSANIDNIRGARELWISGKCIAIHKDVWDKMMEEKGLKP